jgi:hypothetical protein
MHCENEKRVWGKGMWVAELAAGYDVEAMCAALRSLREEESREGRWENTKAIKRDLG